MVWKPHVTVAAIIADQDRFLLVEEHTSNGRAFNQPAGHLEENEDLIAAIKREVNEETAWQFDPDFIVSVQLWRKNPQSPSFLRICFAGTCHSHDPAQKLDEGIISTHWLTRKEMIAKQNRMRSPLVLISTDQYLNGDHYPLDILQSFLDLAR